MRKVFLLTILFCLLWVFTPSYADDCEGGLWRVNGACVDPAGYALQAGWNRVDPGGETACARGDDYTFWVRPGASDQLLVYFEGGGGCWDYDTCQANSSFYSAGIAPNQAARQSQGIFDFDNPENPFKDYNVVYAPSCNGDVYMGDNIVTFSNGDGDTLTHYYKGFQNGKAVVTFADVMFPQPDSVFVTGCSAGSVGSAVFAPHLIEQYPGVPVVQWGDSLSFTFARPVNLDENTYNIGKNMPDWAQTDPSAFVMADYYVAMANHYPDYTFGQFNSWSDNVQVRFYMASTGATREGWESDLDAALEKIEAGADNFVAFTAGGDLHCITPRRQFYNYAANGVRLVEWVSAYAAGEAVESVHCEDCGAAELLEAN